MNSLEYVAIGLTLIGLYLIGSNKPIRRIQGFSINIISAICWCIVVPVMSIIFVNCILASINVVNIYRTGPLLGDKKDESV